MIIVATLKEIKDIINNLNYADNTEVTLTVDADTDMWHNGAVQADEDTVTQPNIGSLERGFVNQFQNIEDLYTIAKDCLEVAAPYEWERDLKKAICMTYAD